MSDLKLENHYQVELNTVQDLYKYKSCRTENIPLFGHQVLPQGYKYGSPSISNNGKYISLIGKGDIDDKAFIWTMDNLDSYLYSYTSSRIETLIFSPNNDYFFILYKNEPPVQYSIKSGEEKKQFEDTNKPKTKIINYFFTPDKKQLGIATINDLAIWDISSGKLVKYIEEISQIKTMRNDMLVSIRDNLEVYTIQISNNQSIQQFTIPNINKVSEILACVISPDLNHIYYSTSSGIYEYKVGGSESKRGDKLNEKIRFNEEVNKVIIDENCDDVISTDMLTINFWKISLTKENNVNVIFKEKFSSINISFQNQLLLIVDELCLNICSTKEEQQESESFIWLNENPKKFLYFSFSPDFEVLLATLDENNAIAYNTKTGRVIKKWRNMEDDWSMACEMAPETSEIAVIATKSDDNTIKIWDYHNGSEVLSLPGYNAHSFSFSSNGTLLVCGAREGEEIARLWDLTSSNYVSFGYKGNNNNTYTIVNMTDEENKKIIAASIDQNPVVFDVENQDLLFECECPVRFEKIQGIQSNVEFNCFLVKGRDHNKKNVAILYNLSNGKLIQLYNDCSNVELAKNVNCIISRSSNINNGNLTISNLMNLNAIEYTNCELEAETSSFLQDYKSIVSAFGTPKNLDFIISDVSSGAMIAEIKFNQKIDRHAEVDLSVNKEENILVLRYLEFIEPVAK